MRLWTALAFSTLALTCGCTQSDPSDADDSASDLAAQPAADAQPNAADAYRRIASRMPKGFVKPIADLAWDQTPSGAASSFLLDQQGLIAEIMAASAIDHCDFNVDLANGFDVLVPHLASMRDMAKMLQADANRLKTAGDSAATTVRLIALVRLGKHSGLDPMLIDKLVCMSILGLANESIDAWKGVLAPEDRRAILAELEAVQSARLLDIGPVVQQELAASKTAIESGKDIELPNRGSVAIAPSERTAVIREVERVHNGVEAAWSKSDAETKIKALVESVRDPKAKFFILNWDSYRKQCSKAEGQLKRAIAAMK